MLCDRYLIRGFNLLFHVDDALMIKVSYRVFRAYDIRYSHRFHQHTVSIIGLVTITTA
jgi:hypothetical protein